MAILGPRYFGIWPRWLACVKLTPRASLIVIFYIFF